MSNRAYDTIKMIALIAVPLVAFIGSICTIWNVEHAEQITATLTALDTLLGAIVAILSRMYNKPLDMNTNGLEYMNDDLEYMNDGDDIEDGDLDE